MFLLYFTLRHRPRPDRLNQPLGGPKTTPKRRPGAARDAPGSAQEAPETAPRASKASQERPQGRPNTASERPGRPRWAQLAHKSRPEAFHRPFWSPPRAGFAPSGGRFSYSFLSSESIAKAVLWAKLAQAYAQHRFTSLCNFYMWISTATDSKSRSTNLCLDGLTTFRLAAT